MMDRNQPVFFSATQPGPQQTWTRDVGFRTVRLVTDPYEWVMVESLMCYHLLAVVSFVESLTTNCFCETRGQFGLSYYVEVNDLPIFAKGANWVRYWRVCMWIMLLKCVLCMLLCLLVRYRRMPSSLALHRNGCISSWWYQLAASNRSVFCFLTFQKRCFWGWYETDYNTTIRIYCLQQVVVWCEHEHDQELGWRNLSARRFLRHVRHVALLCFGVHVNVCICFTIVAIDWALWCGKVHSFVDCINWREWQLNGLFCAVSYKSLCLRARCIPATSRFWIMFAMK